MRGVFTVALSALVGGTAFAQQEPQFTQYMFDRLSVNPAVAGTTGGVCGTLLLRQQWSGFSGAPKTGLLNVHGAIAKINSGVGLSVYLDELGQQKGTIARLSYAYHFDVGGGTLALGLYAGNTTRSLGRNWLSVDPVADDDAIPSNGLSDGGFDAGAGIYYTSNKLWVGISSTQLPQAELEKVSIQNRRHFFIQGGYHWELGGSDKFVLTPSTMLKVNGASTQIDFTAMLTYNKMLWTAVTYRTQDAVAPMIGYQYALAKGFLRLGYSYDVTTSEIKNYSSGSHEVMMGFCTTIVKKPDLQIYRNVRFL
jgi:type IX secretion system PorP/SprF family membrane protein